MRGFTLLVVTAGLAVSPITASPAVAQDGAGPPPVAGAPADGPTARYSVPGRDAWDEARRRGFEFFPVIPDPRFVLSGPRDGVATALKACPDPRRACEAEAHLVEGAMSVAPPRCADGCVRAHVFELFGGRPLAPGWRIARVELEGAGHAWAREPRYGTRDGSFAVRLESRSRAPGSAGIRSLTLLGPAGADWRDAFHAGGGSP